MSEQILVCGHKNPDNDSIMSAVACACLNNAIAEREGSGETYKAVRLGPLPVESEWILEKAGFEAPELIERVEAGQKIVLVDHNESQQAVDGVKEADVVEVVDHHRIGDFSTAKPLQMVFMPWGCTCTILAKMFEAYGVEITKEIATVLLSAILTDTVIKKSPTTTDVDRAVIDQLAEIAGVQADEFGLEIFKCRGGEDKMDVHTLVCADSKEFEVCGKTVLIAARETVDLQGVMAREAEMREHMRELIAEKGYDFVLLMVTDILAEGSQFVLEGNAEVVERTFGITCQEGGTWMPGIMSRKKQVAAPLLQA